jgi:hypothetical protein
VLAGFEILEEINRGGMGVIYKARQQGLNRLVALKIISPDRLANPQALRRFRQEVQAAALLSHPNIVTVYATDLDGPWPYLAMEYVPGIDLSRLVTRAGPLPVADACLYARQAALALQHAFEHGLVHRDIKPHNLMVTPSPLDPPTQHSRLPRVKVLDMGLARVVEEARATEDTAEGLTHAGTILGTPDFMPPEQAEDAHSADTRSDLYSLGCTLYYVLTAEVPFPDTNLVRKLRRQVSEPPPSAAARRPDVPAALDAVVRRLMARDPAERFQEPGELIRALAEVEAVLRRPGGAARPAVKPAPARPVTPPVPPAPEPVRHIEAHAGGVQALCVSPDGRTLLSGGVDEALRLWDADRLRETRCLAHKLGPVEGVAVAPDGTWAASCSRRLFTKDLVVQLWDLPTGRRRGRLRGHTDRLLCVAICRHGQLVAAGGADRTVLVWPADQPDSPAVCLEGHTDQVSCVTFVPGNGLLSGSRDGTVRLWDAKGGAGKGTVHPEVGRVTALAFGVAGKQIAIAGERLRIRQPDGAFRELRGHQGPVGCVAFSPDGRLLLSGGTDGTVRLWRVADGDELQCFQGHGGKVQAVAFGPDARVGYSGGSDGTIRRWSLPA